MLKRISNDNMNTTSMDSEIIPQLNPESPLVVSGLTVAYQQDAVLMNVSFITPKGRMVAIVGPNGAGKSTLLKSTLGLIPRLSGEITVFGKSVSKQRSKIAYVPQRSTVDWDFPASTLDVVQMGLYEQIGWFRWPQRRHRAIALDCLAQVGMADFGERQIGQLSGGQQQRVFIARALAQNAEVFLMDEPLAGVDAATENSIIQVFEKLKREGKTVLVVHHDLETVTTYFEQVLILNKQLIAFGPTNAVFSETNLQKAYGGRLAKPQLNAIDDAINLSKLELP